MVADWKNCVKGNRYREFPKRSKIHSGNLAHMRDVDVLVRMKPYQRLQYLFLIEECFRVMEVTVVHSRPRLASSVLVQLKGSVTL